MLASAAIAVGLCVGGAAPAGADPNPIDAGPNPFGTLSCNCREAAPAGSPELTEEMDRGLQEGHSAWLPGLPAPAQPGQSQT